MSISHVQTKPLPIRNNLPHHPTTITTTSPPYNGNNLLHQQLFMYLKQWPCHGPACYQTEGPKTQQREGPGLGCDNNNHTSTNNSASASTHSTGKIDGNNNREMGKRKLAQERNTRNKPSMLWEILAAHNFTNLLILLDFQSSGCRRTQRPSASQTNTFNRFINSLILLIKD